MKKCDLQLGEKNTRWKQNQKLQALAHKDIKATIINVFKELSKNMKTELEIIIKNLM